MSTHNILYNPENYYKEFTTFETKPYFDKYVSILNQYLLHINENIYVQDKSYQIFIIKRGIDTISHIFTTLLMYTKNVELTYHHVEKSFCYYVEFISQISDESHSFLKLNSKDAALFIYKKTVFDINQEYRKTFETNVHEDELLQNLQTNIKYYNEYIMYLLCNYECYEEDDNDKTTINTAILYIIKYGIMISSYIYETSENDSKKSNDFFHIISVLSFYLSKLKVHNSKIFSICQTMIKKYSVSNTNIDTIYKNLMTDTFEKMVDFTPIKIVNWLIKE